MKVKEIIEQAEEAVRDNFKNYDWQEEAEIAAIRIVDGIELARKIAKAAHKLPDFTRDEVGVKRVFLFWELLGIELDEDEDE